MTDVPREVKDIAIEHIAAMDVDEALKLVAALKTVLLADVDCDGGLNEENRRRAWEMARDLGKILIGRGEKRDRG